MSKPTEQNLVKKSLNLYAGDAEILERFFPQLGWTVAARVILHKTCRSLIDKEAQALAKLPEDLE